VPAGTGDAVVKDYYVFRIAYQGWEAGPDTKYGIRNTRYIFSAKRTAIASSRANENPQP
jgi:hypothetical protein